MNITVALLVVSVLVYMRFFFTRNPAQFYILYVILMLPVMVLPVSPEELGGFTLFDFISYLSLPFLYRRSTETRVLRKYAFIIWVLLFSLILGSVLSGYRTNSLLHLVSLLPILIYARTLVRECINTPGFQSIVLRSVLFSGLCALVFLAVQMAIGLDFTFYNALNRNTENQFGIRYPAYFHDPQKFGQFLCMIAFLFLVNEKTGNRLALKNLLLFLLIILAIFQTGGRAALIGIAIGILVLAVYMGKSYWMLLFMLLAGSLLCAQFFMQHVMALKRSDAFNEDVMFRTALWKEAQGIYLDHPLFGIGYNNYRHFSEDNSDNYYISSENKAVFFDQPESGYWLLLSETGTGGMLCFALLILLPILGGLVKFKARYRNRNTVFYASSLIGWMVSFTSVFSLSDERILIMLVILLALLIASQVSLENGHGIAAP